MTKIGPSPSLRDPKGSGVFVASRLRRYPLRPGALAGFAGRVLALLCLALHAAARRLAAGRALTLRALHRLPERRHQVDDLPLLLGLRLRKVHPFRLRPDQLEQLLPVPVVVLRGIEGLAEVADESLRHLD